MKYFSRKIMEYPLNGRCSEGMWKVVKQRIKDFNSLSDYLRHLIMNDNNIDEYGEKRKV